VDEVGEQEERHLRFVGVGGVEGGDADDTAEEDEGPEDSAGGEEGRNSGMGPVDEGKGVFGEAVVDFNDGEERRRRAARPAPMTARMRMASRRARRPGRKLASWK
jgi:hypothetical protein